MFKYVRIYISTAVALVCVLTLLFPSENISIARLILCGRTYNVASIGLRRVICFSILIVCNVVTYNIAILLFLLAAAMEAPDFDIDALNSALHSIETSSCRAAGASGVFDNVIEHEEKILDYFEEDDLDFIDHDWDRLEADLGVGLATLGSFTSSANWTVDFDQLFEQLPANWLDNFEQPCKQLPTRTAGPVNRLPALFAHAFDTQSMTDFYAKGSSSPQRPEQTPLHDQTNRRQGHSSNNDATPTPAEQLSKPSVWKIIRHVRSREPNWMSSSNVIAVRRIIREKTGIVPKSWQISVMLDVVYTRKDVVVSAGTGSGKSLPYQLIPFIKEDAIVLVILPTIALMYDQVCITICPVTCQEFIC